MTKALKSIFFLVAFFFVAVGIYFAFQASFKFGLVVEPAIASAEEAADSAGSVPAFTATGGVILSDPQNGYPPVPYLLYQTEGGRAATKALVGENLESFAGHAVRVEGRVTFEHVTVTSITDAPQNAGVVAASVSIGDEIHVSGIGVRPLMILPAKPCSKTAGCSETLPRVKAEVNTASGGNRVMIFTAGQVLQAPGIRIALAKDPVAGEPISFVIILER